MGRDDRRSQGRGPNREFRAREEREPQGPDLKPVRSSHRDPEIPDEITEKDLAYPARVELKTLTKENAEFVARHLAMAGMLIDSDPELAHEHALSASRRGGRIPVVRETLAITAYTTGDFALALRELRTYRRLSGRDDQLALMIDAERGLERPERALELGRSVETAKLPADQRVNVAIAMSGARLDLGQPDLALAELEVPELNRAKAFSFSPSLFHAYAEVLEELGREKEAATWRASAERAEAALDAASHDDHETITVITEFDESEDAVDPTSTHHTDVDAKTLAEGSVQRDEVPEASPEPLPGRMSSAEKGIGDDGGRVPEPHPEEAPDSQPASGAASPGAETVSEPIDDVASTDAEPVTEPGEAPATEAGAEPATELGDEVTAIQLGFEFDLDEAEPSVRETDTVDPASADSMKDE